jgi:hypothetical protein
MLTRSRRKTITFAHSFVLKGVDRSLPAGDYEVVTDEQLIEGLSFPVYRRVSTMIVVPLASARGSSVEMVTVDPRDLQATQDQDAGANQRPAADDPSLAEPRSATKFL